MFRFRLRTLLILLGVLPPVIAGVWLYAPIVTAAIFAILFLIAALLVNDWLFTERKK